MMFNVENRRESAGEIWPSLPCGYCVGTQYQSYKCLTRFDSFCHADCFGSHRFATQFIREEMSVYPGGETPRATLNERGALMLLSILSSIIEKKYIAVYGNCHTCELCSMPYSRLDFDCGRFSHLRYFDCREIFAYPERRIIYNAFNEAVEDLVDEYSRAESRERSFGTIYPNCPYVGGLTNWCQSSVHSLYGFITDIVNDGNYHCFGVGIWKDITQRSNYFCGDPSSRKHKDMFGDVFQTCPATFESRGTGYRPALRYLFDELKCLTHCTCTLESMWENFGEYSCTLCELDYVNEWVTNFRRLYDRGFLHGCVCESTDPGRARHKYCHVFGGATIVGRRYNPFAASITMVLLNTFARHQVTRQNLSVGQVCHVVHHARWRFSPSYSTQHKAWSLNRYETYHYRTAKCFKKAIISIRVPSVSGISIVGDLVEGLLPRVMRYRGTCERAFCYYRCECFDNSFRVCGTPWGRHCTGSGIHIFEGSIDVCVMLPLRYREKAGIMNNFVNLSFPVETFPAISLPVVSDRICAMRNAMVIRQCADNLPMGYGRSGLRILYTDWDGSLNDGFLTASAFCNINRAILCIDEKIVVCKMHALNFCRFENPVDNLNAGYFGFGENGYDWAMEQLRCHFQEVIPKFDKAVAECIGEECGESIYKWHYYEISESGCVEVTPGEYPFDPYKTLGYVTFRDARGEAEIWNPQECGKYDAWRTLSECASVQFGGFFQINTWNFGALAPECKRT